MILKQIESWLGREEGGEDPCQPSCAFMMDYKTLEAIRSIVDEHKVIAKEHTELLRRIKVAEEALSRLRHWAEIASHKMLDSDNWPADLVLMKAEEALAELRKP